MAMVSGKRKLAEKPSSLGSSGNPATKLKRTHSPTATDAVKTLSELEYAKLKQYLKEKKKLLKVRRRCVLFLLLFLRPLFVFTADVLNVLIKVPALLSICCVIFCDVLKQLCRGYFLFDLEIHDP